MLRLAGRDVEARSPERVRPQAAEARAAIPWTLQHISLAQLVRMLTGLVWFSWGAFWYGESARPGAGAFVAVVMVAAGLGVLPAAFLVRTEDATRRLDRILFAGTACITALTVVGASTWSAIGTDELAYDQAAAGVLLHGANPYPTSFLYTLSLFGVSAGTMTVHGTVVPWIAYPSLSFLLYVPAVALLGSNSYAGAFSDVVFWIAGIWMLWRLADERVRCWVTLAFGSSMLLAPVLTGDTDALYVPFLVAALWKWDTFGDNAERSWTRWASPIALGLACAVKQTPWLLVPYLVVGLAIEARARGERSWPQPVRYLAIAAAAFLVPNLPFIVWNPAAWAQRTLLPFAGGLLPLGPGPASLIRAYGWGGGNLSFFTAAAALALVGSILLFVARYRFVKPLLPVLPLAGLFLSTRPATSYFLFAIPGLLASVLSVRMTTPQLGARWMRTSARAAAVCAAGALAAVTLGLTARAPFDIAVTGAHIRGAAFDATVHVHNVSGRWLAPAFTVTERVTREPVTVVRGPTWLAPGASADYDLTRPDYSWTPRPGDSFQIEAVTPSPDAVSVSSIAVVPAA